MVELARIDGKLEDVSDEEEEWDDNGNPKFDLARFNRVRQRRTPRKKQTPPEHTNGANNDAGANVGNKTNGGAIETPDADATRGRGRPLVELSCEAWDKAKAAITRGDFLDEDATREELLAYIYLIYKDKRELKWLRLELDVKK
jgi:hypothetical protein